MSALPLRRWFQFSLGTLFVLVTLMAALLAWIGVQLKWINDRHEALSKYIPKYDPSAFHVAAPWSIRVFGESGILPLSITVRTDSELEQVWQLRRLFPESKISIRFARRPPDAPIPKRPTGDKSELRGMGDLDRYRDPRPRMRMRLRDG